MESQRYRIKEKIEKLRQERKKAQTPDLGGENVPMDESLTGEGN